MVCRNAKDLKLSKDFKSGDPNLLVDPKCSDDTLRNDLWMSGDRASASTSTAKVFLRSKSQPLSLGCDFVFN